jgi:hypothetical protein
MFKEEPWKVLVGSGKAVFYVLPRVLQHGVSALAVRISRAWKDPTDRTLDWTDFDEETITCVLRYLYSGTYSLPGSPEDKGPDSQSTPSRQSQYGCQLDSNHQTDLFFSIPGQKSSSTCPKESENSQSCLLIHAKVYSFAERYLLSDLAKFAAKRMKSFLKLHKTSPMETTELMETIQLIYDTTPPAGVRPDNARSVLVKFVATHHERFSKNHQTFEKCDGSFMTELAQALSQLLIQRK